MLILPSFSFSLSPFVKTKSGEMSPKLEKRFVLAACLVHIYKLDHTPKFDFSVSCISLSPCLMVHNTSSSNEESVEMYALSLPMDYRDELKNGFQVERIIC